MQKASKGIHKAAFAIGAAVATGLGVTAKIGWDEFKEAQLVAAQTAAVLKSTGGVANVTAGQVDKLAGSLMRKTGVDDEAIAAGQNLLLSFTNIRNEAGKGNDIFAQTTKTTLDLSVAMGKDMKDSSILVGKAMNDPIKGLTSLTRVGVTFTDKQKAQIKAMVDSGNTMGAQKLILRELNKEFGGSAEAAGKTLPGQLNILKQTFSNFAGELVGRVIPHLLAFGNFMREHSTFAKVLGVAVGVLAGAIVTLSISMKIAAVASQLLGRSMNAIPIFAVISGLILLGVGLIALWKKSETFRKIVTGAWEGIKRVTGAVFGFLRDFIPAAFKFVKDAFLRYTPLGIILSHWREIRDTTVSIWSAVRDKIRDIVRGIREWVGDRMDGLVDFFRKLPGRMGDAIKAGAGRLKEAVFSLLRKALPGWAEDALGISSPSKVFSRIGGAIVDGLIEGMKTKSGDLKNAALDFLLGKGGMGDIVAARVPSGDTWRALSSFAAGQGWAVTSGFRLGDPGLHGQGKAIDIDAGSIAANTRVFYTLLSAFAGRINELFFDPIGFFIDQGRRVAGAIGDHMDHVHIGLFDKGGWLPPHSRTLAINRTPQWEPVGPPGRGGPTVNIDLRGSTFLTNDRETQRKLAELLVPHLGRAVRLNTGAGA